MYAFRYEKYSTTLVELTAAEFKAADHALDSHSYPYVARTSPEEARQWVKNGGHHETPLYVDTYDGGKVRYARDSY